MYKRLQNNSLLSGSTTYLISNFLNAAVPFALLPILTRHLSPVEYGEVAMFQAVLAAMAAFTGLSVQGSASRKYYDGEITNNELKEFIGACLQLLVISSLFLFVILLFYGEMIGDWLNIKREWVIWAVFASAGNFVVNLRLAQWQIRKQAKRYGALQVAQSLMNMSLSLTLVVILVWGAEGRILGQLYSTLIFVFIALLLLNKDGLLSFFLWRPGYVKEALAFGVPLIPHMAGLFLLGAVDRFVVNSEMGIGKAGIYMVAVQLSMVLGIVFDAINKAYVPWLYERLARNHDREKRQIVRYTYIYFAIALLIAAFSFMIGPAVVKFVAGEEYAKAGEVIGWLALGRAFGGMYLMVTNYIFYSKRLGLLSIATIISGMLNVILLFVLVRWAGLEGAAIAFAVSMAFRFLVTWSVAQMRFPMPWFTALERK